MSAAVTGRGDPLVILHVLAPARVGGLERVVQGLAAGQRRCGHDVHVAAVVSPEEDHRAFAAPLREAGVLVHLLRLPPRAYWAERRRVRRLLAALAPDVVHTHGYRSDLLHLGAARRQRVPIVTTVHGSSRLGGVSHLFEWLQERALRRFDGVVAVSQALADRLAARGVPRRRIRLIRNGWNGRTPRLARAEARARLGISGDHPRIGWVGRLIPVKGGEVFLHALARLKDTPWRASVVGDGPERAPLEALARQLGLEQRVTFHGASDDAADLFLAFDCFVLSSHTEGTPMVLFESMAAGVPIVSTSVGGVPEVLSDGEGVLVPPADPDRLAAALRGVLQRPTRARARARNARIRLEREFGAERWLAEQEELYRAVMGGPSRPAAVQPPVGEPSPAYGMREAG